MLLLSGNTRTSTFDCSISFFFISQKNMRSFSFNVFYLILLDYVDSVTLGSCLLSRDEWMVAILSVFEKGSCNFIL